MFENAVNDFQNIPQLTKDAIVYFSSILQNHVSPGLSSLNLKLEQLVNAAGVDSSCNVFSKENDNFTLCNTQLTKGCSILTDVFKKEVHHDFILIESRMWAIERISYCLKKLNNIFNKVAEADELWAMENNYDVKRSEKNQNESVDETSEIDVNFISWVDDALNILDSYSQLFVLDSDKTDVGINKTNWNIEVSSGLKNLNGVIRELLSSAMNMCQGFLSVDQKIVSARCHVVLRESKNFINEILDGDRDNIDWEYINVKDNLHHSTVRMLMEILKDGIYNLEASINRGVLGLVLTCLVNPVEPLQELLKMSETEGNFEASEISDEKSSLIKKFDIHNERLMQIGLFAISCSADKERVSNLRTCLASFESLEPQLVPAVLSAPSSLHTQILAEHWMAEINSLRTLVFLIVDPTAFIEIIMEYYQTKLSILKRELNMTWTSVQYFVGLGKCILDYLTSYIEHEPKAFQQLEKLACIVKDLKKVVKECSVVCDLFLLKPNETHTEINAENDDTSTKEARIMKRLKLLHSLLNKVSNEISDKDMSVSEDTRERLASESDSQSQDSCENSDKESTLANSEKSPHSSVKHKGVMKIFDKFKAVFKTEMAPLSNENLNEKDSIVMENVGSGNKNTLNKTYIRTSFARVAPKHLSKLSSLMFSPSSHDVQSRAKRLEIALKNKSSFHDQSFCFSISNECLNNPADEFMLADISMQDVRLNSGRTLLNEHTPKYRSSFYGNQIRSARRHGNSLRKKLLINRVENHNAVQKPIENASYSHRIEVKNYDSGLLPISSYNVLNGSLDLQITEILEQLTALSDTISLMKIDLTEDKILIEDFDDITKSTSKLNTDDHKIHDITNVKPNILTLKINRNELDSPKNVWNIRVMPDKENTPLSSAAAKPITPSEATNANSLVDCGIDVSFGSNVPTPERMNDLNQLELKLENLKQFWND